MKLIIGLGNPGEKYDKTRHNLGFMAVDRFLEKHPSELKFEPKFDAAISLIRINNQKAIIAKPQTYMNLSGQAVRKIVDYYKIELEDILVIVDDIALPAGKIRLREKGSHGGQNGLKNIISHLGTNDFKRIRIGIDVDKKIPLDQYVLSKLSKSEIKLYDPKLDDVSSAIQMFIEDIPYKDIMTKYNTQE